MLDQLDYLEKTVLESWGGTLNDLEDTSYWHLLDVLNAKEPEGIEEKTKQENIPSAFEFFKNHSISDMD